MERPLLGAALAVLAGSALGTFEPALAPAWPPLLAAAAGAGLGFARCRGRAPFACALVALLGAAGWRAAAELPAERPFAPERALEGVWSPIGNGGFGELAGAPRDGPWMDLDPGTARPGERVRVHPVEEPVPPPRGPYVRIGARGRGTLPVRADQLERLAPAPELVPPFWRGMRDVLRRRASLLPTANSRGLARALVCGDRTGLDRELADLFARTGTRHLLAVSGTHVALMVWMLAVPLTWLGRAARPTRRRWGAILAAAALLLYAPLAGGGAPVRRAALALALARLAALVPASSRDPRTGRRPDALSLWSLALLLECAADPLAPAQIGVSLSYLATLGLILGARRTAESVAGWVGHGARSRPRTRGEPPGRLRVIAARTGRAGVVTVGASLAAVVATLPVAWAAFGETCPSGVLATAVVLPLVAWLLVVGWVGLLVGPPFGAELFAVPAEWLVSFLEVWDALPGTPVALPLRPAAALAAAGAATLAGLGGVRGGARVAALAWGIVLIPWTAAPAGLELVALDVGHGTAVVLRAPGLPGLVFDAGSRDRAGVDREALGPLLAAWEVRHPVVVLSHRDRDHASALPWLLERRPPSLFAGALAAPLRERLAHTAQVLDATEGLSSVPLTLGGAVEGRILRGAGGAGNEGSRSLLLELAGTRVALLGDAEAEGLAALLRSGALEGPWDVLLAPHHGSETPWLVPLLEAGRPGEVWISRPAEPPIARELDRRGIPWRCTSREGTLTFRAPWHTVR